MSQRFSLYEDLTVEENIAFYGGVYRIPASALKAEKPARPLDKEQAAQDPYCAGIIETALRDRGTASGKPEIKPTDPQLHIYTAGCDGMDFDDARQFQEIDGDLLDVLILQVDEHECGDHWQGPPLLGFRFHPFLCGKPSQIARRELRAFTRNVTGSGYSTKAFRTFSFQRRK